MNTLKMSKLLKVSFLLALFVVAESLAEEVITKKTVKKSEVDLKEELKPQVVELDPPSPVPSTAVPVAITNASELTTTAPEIVVPVSESVNAEIANETPTAEQPSLPIEIPDKETDSEEAPSNILPLSEEPKRKVVYINQQQNGKLNVHLELNDVSVIVIPNQKDPQLSLLNLLFKSAQKSRMENELKKKNENRLMELDDYSYSKFHQGYMTRDVESRAPYKVDISSTTGQPAVEVLPHAHSISSPLQFNPQMARSPILELLKPMGHKMVFKRSIDGRLLEEFSNGGLDVNDDTDDELSKPVLNSLETYSDLESLNSEKNDSEFILLGAIENCGPGRKRNSYQICVSVQ